MKVRGQAPLPGLHTVRITKSGLHVFPRIIRRMTEIDGPRPSRRLSTGIGDLDAMLGGGIPAWDALLVTGPAGSGKSTLATQFVSAGLAGSDRRFPSGRRRHDAVDVRDLAQWFLRGAVVSWVGAIALSILFASSPANSLTQWVPAVISLLWWLGVLVLIVGLVLVGLAMTSGRFGQK